MAPLRIKLIRQQRLLAQAEAYQEAAAHLELSWTDDPTELREGRKLAKRFFRRWAQLLDEANNL